MTESIFKPLYLPQAERAAPLQPTLAQTLSSAFGLENDIANMYELITRPVYEPDINFKFQAEFEARKLPISWMPMLAPANSKAEFDQLLGRVQKEYQDKAVLSASGWSGTVAALAAGIISPTVFIPFTGQARGVKAVAEMVGLAAAGATAQNAALFFNQTTRTEAELYNGIAMDTLLMGMMGGAYLGLSRGARARLADDVQGNQSFVQVPAGPPDLPNGITTVQVDDVGNEFTGTLRALHGYSGREAFAVDPAYKGERYEANSFGNDGLYLDETGKWTSNDPQKMMFSVDKVAELDVTFTRALVMTPENARFITKAAATRGLLSGEELAEWAKAEGYDGLIVRGFDDAQQNTVGPIPEDYSGEPGPVSDRIRAFENSVKEMGLAEEIGQDQIFSFKLDNVVVHRDGLAPGTTIDTGMASRATQTTIPDSATAGRATDAEAAGAQITRTRNVGGVARAPSKARQIAMNTIGAFNPVFRVMSQPFFPSARDGIAKMDRAGLRQEGIATREGSPDGGEVITRIRGYDFYTFRFTQALEENWLTYYLGGKPKGIFDTPMITQAKSVYGQKNNGRLNWFQYKAAVFDGLNRGDASAEIQPSVDALAQFFAEYNNRHKQYLKEFADRGLDVKPLYTELLEGEFGEGVVNYAHHIPDANKIMENIPEFLRDFGGYNERSLTDSFERAFKKYAKRKMDLQVEQGFVKLAPEELSGRLEEIEADLEFLEELPEWSAFRQERLDINRQAKDESWSKEQLKAAQKELVDGVSPELAELQAERAGLMKLARTVRGLGGDSARVTAKLQVGLNAADDLIAGMLRTTLPQLQKADLSIAKLQKQGDSLLTTAAKDIRKVVLAMQNRQGQMKKLLLSKRGNTSSRAKVAAHLDALKLKHEAMLERLSVAEGINVSVDVRLSEINLLREDAIREAVELIRKRSARADDLEDKLEVAEAKVVTPEDRARITDQIGEDLLDLDRNFEYKWSGRGNQSDELLAGKSDFKARSIEMATMLQQRLTHSEVELSPAWVSLRKDARGAALLRVWKIPYDIKNKWLVKDVEMITRSFDRSMAPDLELWRAFDGSPSAKSLLSEMQTELTEHLIRVNTAKYVRLPKGWVDKSKTFVEKVGQRLAIPGQGDELFIGPKNFSDVPQEGFVEVSEALRTQLAETFVAAGKNVTEDIDVAIQRLRGLRGRPLDSASPWWRAGKSIKELNVTTMMGGVIPASLSDVVRPLSKYSFPRVFRTSWKPFITSLVGQQGKEYRIKSREINARVVSNIEPLMQSRAQAVFDTTDETIGRTLVERGITMASQKMGIIALFSQWTALMKTLAGNVTHATVTEYVPNVAKNIREGVEPAGDALEMRTYLRNLGLRDMDIMRIAQEMEKPGGVERFSNGGILPNLGAWENPAAVQAYQAAITTDVANMIVTPGLERPNVVDQNMAASMLFQFKGFMFASNSRITMSNLQGNDPYLAQGLAFSLAFGALSYYAYAMATGGKTWEKAMEGDVEDWMWQATMRSGIMGVLSLPFDVASRVPMLNGSDSPELFRKPSGVLGSLLGPTYTQLDRLGEFVMKMDSDSPEQQERNMKLLRQVFVPYQNVFYLRQGLDRIAEAMFGANE